MPDATSHEDLTTDREPDASANRGAEVDIDALLSRLQVIEDQPLADRATAFAQLHDELRITLEGADASA